MMRLTSIRLYLLWLGMGPMLLIATILTVLSVHYRFAHLQQALKDRGHTLAHQLAIASIHSLSTRNQLVLQDYADRVLRDKNVVAVAIYDAKRQLLAEAAWIPPPPAETLLTFEEAVRATPLPALTLPLDPSFFLSETDPRAAVPIGYVRVTLSSEEMQAMQRQALRENLLIMLGGVAFAALLAAWLGTRVSDPIVKLTGAVNAVASGDKTARAHFAAKGELQALRDGFNVMADTLQRHQTQLELRIAQATAQLHHTLQSLEQKNRKLEEARAAAIAQNEAKSQFLAQISHEIRTPMNGILGFADLLAKTPLTDKQREHVQLITRSAMHLLGIVNEILDHFSLESGRFKIAPQPFLLPDCLEECLTLFSPQAYHIALILDIAPEVPSVLHSDPTRLKQILTNLLSNAVRHTEHGHVVVRCRKHDDQLLFTVSDSGSGISSAQRRTLFAPFHTPRQQQSFSTGSGLGLSITKHIIERLGGQLGCLSQRGIGTTFWFTLPLPSTPVATVPKVRWHVGLIDAQPLRARALTRQLQRIGCLVTWQTHAALFDAAQLASFDALFWAPDAGAESAPPLAIGESAPPRICLATERRLHHDPGCHASVELPCRSTYLRHLLESLTSTSRPLISPPPVTPNAPTPHHRVLLADDNDINRCLMQQQLAAYCTDLIVAQDGEEAWRHAQQQAFDLILLDVQMPGLSGLAVAERIKTHANPNRDTPLIAITAHAQQEQRQRFLAAGFDDCLIKPVLSEQLAELFTLWLATTPSPTPAPPPRRNDATTLDASAETRWLQRLLAKIHDETLARRTLEKLFDELTTHLDVAQQAWQRQDYDAILQSVHRLNGSLSFCDLPALRQHADAVETALRRGAITEAQSAFATFQHAAAAFLAQRTAIWDEFGEQETT